MRIWAGVCSLLLLLASFAQPASTDELVVDDASSAAQITGTWATSSVGSGFVGSGYRYRVGGDGSSGVTWPFPSTAAAGGYEVFARWTSGPNRASNAGYVVMHAVGTTTVSVDQRSAGGSWQSLGTFSFNPGANQGVRLTDKADGVVVADAVHWVLSAAGTQTATSRDPRFFDQTGYRIDRDDFWDFFQKRGGVRAFGYPVSREFTFFGCQTQFFQRLAMQECGNQGVGTLNILEEGLLPYNRFHGSTVPMPDPALITAAPLSSDPAFAAKAINFVRENAPEVVDGESVKFFSAFQNTVSLNDAFPQGSGDPALLPLLNLQLWGLPTSKPAYDPTNHDFIYLRFQRGVMHCDKGCQCTPRLAVGGLSEERADGRTAAGRSGCPSFRQSIVARHPRRSDPPRRDVWRCIHGTVAGGGVLS